MTLNRRTLLSTTGVFAISLGLMPFTGAGLALAQDVDKEKLMTPGPLGEMAIGPDDAKVTIIEYASATCPHCARFHEGTFKELKEKYVDTGKVRFVFREFPFDDLALAAFMLARCAPKEKYFPMIDVIFKEQKKWASRDANPRDELFRIAKLAAFTKDSFNACLKNEEVAKGILNVRQVGQELGVDSTPSFFVNGEKLSGNANFAKFEELITKHLN
ncbi:MAG: DsbA family protein [Hyphomicrobiales bacterium]